MQLFLFLSLLSSAFFVPVLTGPPQPQLPTAYFDLIGESDLSFDDINERLKYSRVLLDECQNGSPAPSVPPQPNPTRENVEDCNRLDGCQNGSPGSRPNGWFQPLMAKLHQANTQPRPAREGSSDDCNAMRWILIDDLLRWFRYAEKNFEMSYEKLKEEVTLEDYKLHDSEFRDALQLYAIMAKMETSGRSFEAEKDAFRRRPRVGIQEVDRDMELLEQKIGALPNDHVLMSASRNMYLWTTIGMLDPLYDTKISMNPWKDDPKWTEPNPGKPHDNPHYDDWRLAAYDGFLAALGLRRQFVPGEDGKIKPVDSKDTGIYIRDLTYHVATERLKLAFPMANRRLKLAYTRKLWQDKVWVESKSEEVVTQIGLRIILGIIKDLQDYFESMERVASVRKPQDSERYRHRDYSDWYLRLACQYVRATGIELGSWNNPPPIDILGVPKLISSYNDAVVLWRKVGTSDMSPVYGMMREIIYCLFFTKLHDSNPSAFPFSLEAWRFSTLRRLALYSTSHDIVHYETNKSLWRKIQDLRHELTAYTNRLEKPGGLEDYPWDYGVYFTTSFEPLHPALSCASCSA